MAETVQVDLTTVRRYVDLFVQVRRPYIVETEGSWLTRKSSLTERMVHQHLHGNLTVGVRVEKRRGRGRIATNIAMEADFGDREEPLDAVLPRILGEPGLAFVHAVHDAGRDLQIPEAAWFVSWSGGRSLHAWLSPRDPVKLATAHAVAQAVRDGVDARIASHGLHVCHAWPTNGTGEGMGIRLPWGRHQRTGERGRFVQVQNGALTLRDPFPDDTAYLATLETNRVDADLLIGAASLAETLDIPRPVRTPRPRLTLPATAQDEDHGDHGERIERSLPTQARRLARPCILHLLESGVQEGLRHDMALLLRAELVHCGLTPEDAWPVYRRYAAVCRPSWETEDARRDLEANWNTTDPSRRHTCPGRGDPSPITQYLHDRCCIGIETCGWRRAVSALDPWREYLTADARTLYMELALMEAGYSLRPGDGIHTTAANLMEQCGFGRTRFKQAREDLEHAGLTTHEATGRHGGEGTADGGVHSVYRRTIPVPDPPG